MKYVKQRMSMRSGNARYSSDEHAKPVCPNMATATPLGSPRPQTAQEQHAGSLKVDAQPSAARIHLPEGAARTVSASVRRAYIRDTSAASGPESATWKDPDPRRRSSRGSGGSE